VARVLRSSPQFGFTLVAYEYLHKVSLICYLTTAVFSSAGPLLGYCLTIPLISQFLPYPFVEKPPELETRLTAPPEDITRVRARNALKILLDCHSDWGVLTMPSKFMPPK
jgi:solute carrier family 25 aspartate/glutamate transporter 12/13